jgi:hypothetical protein
LRTITAPAQSKIYTVINATTGGFGVNVVGAGPTTGVTIAAGESAVIAWNGSDFIKISNTSGAGVFTSLTNTSLTSGRVVYSTTGGLETDSANLAFTGTQLVIGGGSAVTKLTVAGALSSSASEAVTYTTSGSTATANTSLFITSPVTLGTNVSYGSLVNQTITGTSSSGYNSTGYSTVQKLGAVTGASPQAYGFGATISRGDASDTATGATLRGGSFSVFTEPTLNSAATVNVLMGLNTQSTVDSPGLITLLGGVNAPVSLSSPTATTNTNATSVTGVSSFINVGINTGTAGLTHTVGTISGVSLGGNIGSGTVASTTNVTTVYRFNSGVSTIGSATATATVTNWYGLNIGAMTLGALGTITNRYGIYVADTVAKNYFGGFVGIGNTAPAFNLDVTGTANITGAVTLAGGTANGVAYLNGSKVLTTGATLVTDGTNLLVNTATAVTKLTVNGALSSGASEAVTYTTSAGTATANTSQFINSPVTLGTNISIGSLVNQAITGTSSSGYNSTGYSAVQNIGAITGTGSLTYGFSSIISRGNASDTTTNGQIYGFFSQPQTLSTLPSSATTNLIAGYITSPAINGGGLVSGMNGLRATMNQATNPAANTSSTTVCVAQGGINFAISTGVATTHTTTTAAHYLAIMNFGSGSSGSTSTATTYFLVGNLSSPTIGSATDTATITNWYGVNLLAPTVGALGTITNRWGIYSSDTVAKNYFGGTVAVGTTTPSASAILDAQSTTKGVRMPNMTTTQKNAIASPAAGLMVFDTTLAKLCVYSGAAWQTITSI